MKTATFAAAGLTLATLATAVPMCAINCFQSVIAEHPPLDCTEANMYLCFCKRDNLQNYFIECAYSDCNSDADAAEAVGFGVGICQELGAPITIPTGPPTKPTEPAPVEPTPTEPAPVEPTDDDSTPEPTDDDSTPEPTDPAEPTDSSSGVKPTQSSTDSGVAQPSGTGAPTPDDDDEDFVQVNMANGKTISGLLAAAGVAVAML